MQSARKIFVRPITLTPTKDYSPRRKKISVNGMTFADARLLIRELPNLLTLPYPVVKDLRNFSLQIISQMLNAIKTNGSWKDYVELDFIRDLIKIGG